MYVSPWLQLASWAFVVLATTVIYYRQMHLTGAVEEHLEECGRTAGFQAAKKLIEPVPEALPPALPMEAKDDAPRDPD